MFQDGVITGGPVGGGDAKPDQPDCQTNPDLCVPDQTGRVDQPSPDQALSTKYGAPLDASRFGVLYLDSLFKGSKGAQFREAVAATAADYDLNPGLLTMIAAAEHTRDTYLSPGPVEMTKVGLDFWGSSDWKKVTNILRKAGAERQARDTPQGTPLLDEVTKLPKMFRNRPTEKYPEGRITGPIVVFDNGQLALRAMAARVRANEISLSLLIGKNRWENLPAGTQFQLLRIYYNPGPKFAQARAKRAANGEDVLIRDGPFSTPRVLPNGKTVPRYHGERIGTVRAAQALHTSCVEFKDCVE
jgi:hypothetical protein